MVKSPMKGNQLVLIKMESPVIDSEFVRPVCLARDHQAWIETPSSRCLYLGWGKDRNTNRVISHDYNLYIYFFWNTGDSLHEVTAKVVQSPNCDNVTSLCVDVLTAADACQVIK